MTTALWALGSVFLVSFISLIGVMLLAINEAAIRRNMLTLVSFSTGAMLGNVFLHLLPEMAEQEGGFERGLPLVLAGIIASFLMEKFIHWRHCHDLTCEAHVHPAGPLVLMGDAAHNIIDGVLIAGAYLVSVPLGVATTAAVVLHEIPQEFGDFAVLLHSGYAKRKALVFNFFSACTAFLGAVLVLLLSRQVEGIEAVLVPLAAGNFLYIAGSDLIPELHKETRGRQAMLQLLGILAGIALMYAIVAGTHEFVPGI